MKKDVFTMKWPSLAAKNWKNYALKKKFGRIDSRLKLKVDEVKKPLSNARMMYFCVKIRFLHSNLLSRKLNRIITIVVFNNKRFPEEKKSESHFLASFSPIYHRG